MTSIGSMVVVPADALWLFPLLLVLLLAGFLGAGLSSWEAGDRPVRRLSLVIRALGLLGFAGFEVMACFLVADELRWRETGWARGWDWVSILDYPLHASASAWTWLLATSLLSAVLIHGRAVHRELPILVVTGAAIAALVVGLGSDPGRDHGLRPPETDLLDSHWGLMASHPTIFPAVRLETIVVGCMSVLTLLSLIAFVRSRRHASRGEKGGTGPWAGIEVESMALFVIASVLWGQIRLLSVAQAVRWASPRTPPEAIDAAFQGVVLGPLACLVFGMLGTSALALAARRRASGPVEPHGTVAAVTGSDR